MKKSVFLIWLFLVCHTMGAEVIPKSQTIPMLFIEEGQSYHRTVLMDKYLCRTSDTESLFSLASWKSCSDVLPDGEKRLLWKKLDFEIHKPISNPLFFSYYLALEDSVELWLYRNDLLIDMQTSGASIDLEQRPVASSIISLPILVRDPGEYTAFIRTISHNPPQKGPSISHGQLLNELSQISQKVLYPYLGVGVAVLIINTLMFAFIRKKTYLPYILFHICFVFSVLVVTGQTVGFIPMIEGGYSQYLPLLLSGVGFFYLWFSAWYFNIVIKKSPLFILLMAISLLNTITWSLNLTNFVTQELFLCFVVLMCLYSIYRYRQDSFRANLFLLSWVGYTCFVATYALYKNGQLPNYTLVKYSAILGHIWEMTFFTVAMAHQMFRELNDARLAAINSEMLKDNLLQQIAHELKTPMTGILGEVEHIGNEKLDIDTKDLSHSAYQLEHILNNIIDVTDYLGNTLSNQDDNKWVDVVNLVLSKAKVVSEEYEQIKTSMNILKPSYLIRMNEKIYSKAVLQFLDNAYKFSSKGTVHITMIWAKNSFRLKISNPCEVNPQLVMGAKKKFELKQENSGLGLGYLIGQKAMKDSKGQVSTDYDEESKVFEVLLDLPYITKKLISELPNNLKLETLLIVDDNKINRKVLGRIGEQFGYQVFFAETGLSGVKHFIKIKPDIVFMDIQMPVMDGLQSTELIRKYELKNHLERSCILGITAHGTHLYEDKCKAAGMDFMVNKPVKKDQIQDAILSMTTNR